MVQAPHSVGKLAREGVLTVLRDPQYGWNAVTGKLAVDAGIDWNDLDLDEEQGPDLFIGQYAYEQLLDSSDFIPRPVTLVVYTASRQMHNLIQQKSVVFAGSVGVEIESHLSWSKTSPVDTETWIDVVEAGMVFIFNRLGVIWPREIGYNGNIQVVPGPVQYGAQNWRCVIRTGLIFSARVI